MESVKQTEQKAAEWLTRRDGGNWSPNDQTAFDQWLNESTGNVVAFVRLESAWNRADRFKALGAGFPAGKIPTPEEFNLSPFFTDDRDGGREGDADGAFDTSDTHTDTSDASDASDTSNEVQQDSLQAPETLVTGAAGVDSGTERVARRFRMRRARRAIAASIVVALIASAIWFYWPVGPDYKTPVGGTASVPMADGSKVTLNTDSAIRIALTENEREVRLDQGEAFFEVAHDPSRPFVVSAGNKRVIAVGTKFSVRRIGDDIRVFVTEGKVRLEEHPVGSLPSRRDSREAGNKAAARGSSSPPDARWDEPGEGTRQDAGGGFFLAVGSIARTDGDGILVQEKPLAEVEESLSWRTGYIIFHESTLADAVVEFNRYNVRKIFIEDADVAGIKLSGKFRTTDFEAFVRLIEGGFPLHVRQSNERLVLTKN